jgi:hypothetical protein
MRNMKFMIEPLIIGYTGAVTKRLKKHLEAMLGKHSIDFLKNTAMLGT